ncbi:alpha/beta hydrolase [Streptomyces sp. NBC_00344]|uniref:alpha/beta hydrolase n=1 Tax=Streptomyces sp. NBC_00344 TaxID=2975720 RepID=UPI002E245A1D
MTALIRRAALASAALLIAGTVTGCDSGTDTGGAGQGHGPAATTSAAPRATRPSPSLPSSLTGRRLHWHACDPQGWECATAKAPLDYARPAGPTVSLALIRKPARDRERRLGSLLFNFGGPGGSGVDILPAAASAYGDLNSRYDLVSWDPRGVARSAGVVCRSDKEQAAAERNVDLTPDTPAEQRAYLKDGADFGAGCERQSGRVLPWIGTSNSARDMDLIRQVLGEPKLNYFGISYGTELGGTYAHLFPGKAGRTVLDAVVDPTADTVGHARNQTLGFQRALDDYLRSTGQDPKAGTARIAALLKRVDAHPLPTGTSRGLNQSLALTGIIRPLYSKDTWPSLTRALGEAEEKGTGRALLALADAYNDRDAEGHYSTQSSSQRAIDCADSKARPTAAQAAELLPAFRKLSPVFGDFLAWDTAGWCSGWPVAGERDHPEASAKGAGPIMVVGTTGDPATPFEGARRMAGELGPGVGVLLVNKGEGHGAYNGGSECVTRTVNAYLLEGKVPADGTVCTS